MPKAAAASGREERRKTRQMTKQPTTMDSSLNRCDSRRSGLAPPLPPALSPFMPCRPDGLLLAVVACSARKCRTQDAQARGLILLLCRLLKC